MATFWIIDGYNFIRQSQRFAELEAHDGKRGKQAALEWLGAFSQKTGEQTVVVFDAYSGLHSEPIQHSRHGIKIIESRGSYSADEEIMLLAKQYGERAVIISSDREIQRHALQSGCSILNSDEFERELGRIFQAFEQEEEGLSLAPRRKGLAFRPPKEKKKAFNLLRKYQ